VSRVTPIHAVLFDWGDTLFRKPHAPSVLLEAARAAHVPLADMEATRLWDELWSTSKTAEEHAKGRDLSREAHRRVWTELLSRADERVPGVGLLLYERVMDPTKWVPYPDAERTLRALRERRVPVGIVSNTAHDLRPLFDAQGLAPLIDAYAFSYEIGAQKPDPRIFDAACAMLHARPAETLMVGDDPVSDAGAGAAGLQIYMLPPEDPSSADRDLHRVVELVDRSRAGRS
jgi:HAD superfamily hydrolase (TIGR01509 family)